MANDVKMFYIEDDIKKIQTKTNLYIQQYGPAGAFHLAREVIQNNIDELIDPESNGNEIYISYDILDDRLTSSDNSRGFPEKDYPLDIFCTKNQSGSKFYRDQGGGSSGEFGVGLTVVNALSDEFILSSYREAEKYAHTIKFKEGEKVSDTKRPLKKSDPIHGSSVSFIPSKKYLGNNTKMPYKELIDWVEKMMYFIRKKKFKIKIDIFKGMTLKETYSLKPRNFDELLEKIVTDNSFSPKCTISGDSSIKELVRQSIFNKSTNNIVTKEVMKDKYIHLDVAFRYVPDSVTFYDSYCNFTNTTDGGVHQDTVEKCFCNYMQSKTKATMTDAQKEKLPILWDDIRSGLCCVINLSTDAQVQFLGNQKQRIGNKDLIPQLSEIVTTQLDKFFMENPNCLNEYIKIIKLNAKARVEAAKVKTAVQKERMTSFKEHELTNYIRCNNTGKKWKEIFLVEGNSASGSARNGCDPDTQAFVLFRGVTANPFKCSLAEIMQNNEWKGFVTILRCGIGASFDINKLYFNRINIMTDEDIDGFGISSGMLAFIYKYYRPLIEAGLVYKVFSPLYALEDKDHPFVNSKAELVELYYKKVAKNYKIKSEMFGDKYMSKNDIFELLLDAYDYRENLINVSKDLGKVNKFLIEAIIAYMVLCGAVRGVEDYDDLKTLFGKQKFVKYLMSNLQAKFPEVTLDDDTVIGGVVEGKVCSLDINKRFIRKTSSFVPVILKYGYILEVSENGKDPVKMSISEFLDAAMKYMPVIKTRYKGLGELNGDQLRKTTLDINSRVSVQYTVENAKRELEIMNMIHGPSKKDLEKRKKMMKKYHIKRDDLDN